MRAIAKSILRPALLILTLLTVLQWPLAKAYGMEPETQEMCDGTTIEGYCEPSAISAIINLENCDVGNKIKTENGCLKIVKETNVEATYTMYLSSK